MSAYGNSGVQEPFLAREASRAIVLARVVDAVNALDAFRTNSGEPGNRAHRRTQRRQGKQSGSPKPGNLSPNGRALRRTDGL